MEHPQLTLPATITLHLQDLRANLVAQFEQHSPDARFFTFEPQHITDLMGLVLTTLLEYREHQELDISPILRLLQKANLTEAEATNTVHQIMAYLARCAQPSCPGFHTELFGHYTLYYSQFDYVVLRRRALSV